MSCASTPTANTFIVVLYPDSSTIVGRGERLMVDTRALRDLRSYQETMEISIAIDTLTCGIAM